MNKSKYLLVLLLLSVGAFSQATDSILCALSSFTNGQIVTVHGKVNHGAHDMTLDVPKCDTVVLTYADDPDFSHAASATSINLPRETAVDNGAKLTLRKDREFLRFQKYVAATYKSTRKNICIDCYEYEVEATFTGRLDVSKKVGLTHDEKGEKIISMDGFGHPVPFTRYRFVIESVSDVRTRKLPKPGTDQRRGKLGGHP